jgi:signal transduction histidine kinase
MLTSEKFPIEPLPSGLEASLLHIFLQQPGLGVSVCAPDWTCLYGNDFWFQITGLPVLVRRPLFDLLPPLEPALRPFLNDLTAGKPIPRQTIEVELNGRFVFWQVTLHPMHKDSALHAIFLLLEDHTEQVRSRQQLERRVADRTHKLSTLYELITATAEAPDLRSTLAWSLQRVLEAVKCPAGAIQLIDDFDKQAEGLGLRLVACEGLPDEIADLFTEATAEQGFVRLSRYGEAPVIIPNLAAEWSEWSGFGQLTNLQTYVGAAMMVRERVVGVLHVIAENGRQFGEIELALLNSVADQIGIVVENAYLHKRAAETAVIEERHRLARDLHDSVTQAIYSLTLFTEAGIRLLRTGSYDRIENLFLHLNETSQKALREMRLLLHKLRPPDLEAEGLVGALQQRLDEVETRANVEAHLIVEGDLDELPEAVEEQLYRIAQEALNNALKHSSASVLKVHISAAEEDVTLVISDDGSGFDVAAAQQSGGMGLQNIEERVDELDGELTIESMAGQGTTISVQIDMDELKIVGEDELF